MDLTPTADKPGWEFIGWHTDPDATVPLRSLAMPRVPALTLYAIFRLEPTVTFVDYNDSGAVTREVPVFTFNRDIPASATHTLDAPAQNSPTGWTALGWTYELLANAPPVGLPAGGTVPFHLRFYGLYSVPVTLSYNANGGDYTPSPMTRLRFHNSHAINAPLNPLFTIAFSPKARRNQRDNYVRHK